MMRVDGYIVIVVKKLLLIMRLKMLAVVSSSLSCNSIDHIALTCRVVGWFSVEMPAKKRFDCQVSPPESISFESPTSYSV